MLHSREKTKRKNKITLKITLLHLTCSCQMQRLDTIMLEHDEYVENKEKKKTKIHIKGEN